MVILIQKVEISNFAAFLYATKLLISTILILIIVLFIFFYVLKHNLYILNILINLFTFGITYSTIAGKTTYFKSYFEKKFCEIHCTSVGLDFRIIKELNKTKFVLVDTPRCGGNLMV